jgi:hypothetical protein
MELLLRVTRGEDNRLSGTVCTTDRAQAHDFSGTLELMRVFEELVPVDRDDAGEEKDVNQVRSDGRTWTDGIS